MMATPSVMSASWTPAGATSAAKRDTVVTALVMPPASPIGDAGTLVGARRGVKAARRATDTPGVGSLALTTRLAVVLMWAVAVTVLAFIGAVCWAVWFALTDEMLFALAAIVAPVFLGGLGMLLAAVPGLFRFVVNFSNAESSAYFGGFVPAVAALGVALLLATVGLPLVWWIGPLFLGCSIVALLVHPDTREDFLEPGFGRTRVDHTASVDDARAAGSDDVFAP
jgi:hypothetical protein